MKRSGCEVQQEHARIGATGGEQEACDARASRTDASLSGAIAPLDRHFHRLQDERTVATSS